MEKEVARNEEGVCVRMKLSILGSASVNNNNNNKKKQEQQQRSNGRSCWKAGSKHCPVLSL